MPAALSLSSRTPPLLPQEERLATFTRDVVETGIMTRGELTEANKVRESGVLALSVCAMIPLLRWLTPLSVFVFRAWPWSTGASWRPGASRRSAARAAS